MTYLLPLPVPEILAKEHGIDPKNDYSYTHDSVGFTLDGRGYVVSEVYYYYGRYQKGDERTFHAYVVTVLDQTFSIERQVVLDDVLFKLTHQPDASGVEQYLFNNRVSFGTSAQELVFANSHNVTYVYDGALEQRAAYDPLRGGSLGVGYAAGRPGGGYLCTRGKHEVMLAKPGLALRDGLPDLEPIGTLLEPEGSLAKQTGFDPYRGFFHKLAVLDDDRFLASYFVTSGRSGFIDHDSFRYVVFDAAGKVVGTLPLGAADSPYKPTAQPHLHAVGHARLGGWLTRSEYAVHAFDRDGTRLARVALQDDKFEGLPELHLFGAAPTGELLLVSRKHSVLVVTNPIARADEIGPAFAEIAAVYKTEHARLKKAAAFSSGRFHSFERVSPRADPAAASAPKKPAKKKPVAAPAPNAAVAPAVQASKDPEEGMACNPDDLDARAVYGDWLAEQGDRAGDFIVAACRLARTSREDAQRPELARRVDSIWIEAKDAWNKRFNTPEPLFDDHTERTGGLPEAVRLKALPRDPKNLDAQLARLPLRSIAFCGLGYADLLKASNLRSLKRITTLEIVGDSKTKLGKNVVEWLAGLQLGQLRRLYFYRVTLTGRDATALLATLPALEELKLSRCDVTPEVLLEIGRAPAADKLRVLELRYNPLGSAGLAHLSRFPAIQRLDLYEADIGDDVSQLESVPHTGVASLDLSNNERLKAKGLAWMARTFPKVTELDLPKSIDAAGVDALMPLAAGLVRLGASSTELPARKRIVSTLLPVAKGLRGLDFGIGPNEKLVTKILAADSVESLDLGDCEPEDRQAIVRSAGSRRLRHLDLDELDDETAAAFASSENLRGLETLRITSRALGHDGIRALLTLPSLRKLSVLYSKIRNADLAPAARIPELNLVLQSCDLTPAVKKSLQATWQHRLRFI